MKKKKNPEREKPGGDFIHKHKKIHAELNLLEQGTKSNFLPKFK